MVVIAGFTISGEPPDPADDSAREIVDFYVDNKSSLMAGSFLEGLAAALLVFFGAYLREVLRVTAGGKDFLSTAAFAGTLIIAVGLAFDGTINLALAETAKDIDPVGVQALTALYHHDFIPFAVGSVVFLVGTGISVLQHGALPKWIGWIALVLAVIAFTPIGFFAFIGSGILIAVMGVTLAIRGRAKPAAT
ncbi:MAG: hypothetical protein LC777_14375 [Actinobacteria bacterium]|nr:hypothetical protein [Actinomycetota bacterium]